MNGVVLCLALIGQAEVTTIIVSEVVDRPATVRLVDATLLRKMWQRSNELRVSRGLKPHVLNERLCAAAQDHANYMTRSGMDHYTNSGPGGRARRYGFRNGVLENIAVGQSSVHSVFNVWINSGGHRSNMMSGTASAGFGVAVDSGGNPYWCAVYGSGGDGDVEVVDDEPVVSNRLDLPEVQAPPEKLTEISVTFNNYNNGRRFRRR